MNANVNENVLVNGVNNNVENSAKVEKEKTQKTTAKKSTKKESAKVEKKEVEKLSFSKLLETLDTTGLHTNSGLKKRICITLRFMRIA